jgi:hypothetical protein
MASIADEFCSRTTASLPLKSSDPDVILQTLLRAALELELQTKYTPPAAKFPDNLISEEVLLPL